MVYETLAAFYSLHSNRNIVDICRATSFFTDALLQQTYGGQLAFDRISAMFALSRKWQWVGYAIIPVVIILRVFYTSVFLYTGLFFADISTGFGKIFKIALCAGFASKKIFAFAKQGTDYKSAPARGI